MTLGLYHTCNLQDYQKEPKCTGFCAKYHKFFLGDDSGAWEAIH